MLPNMPNFRLQIKPYTFAASIDLFLTSQPLPFLTLHDVKLDQCEQTVKSNRLLMPKTQECKAVYLET